MPQAPTIDEVLAYIESQAEIPPRRRPGRGITIAELSERRNLTYSTAKHVLARMVKEGKLAVKRAIDGGGVLVNVYYPPGTEDEVFVL